MTTDLRDPSRYLSGGELVLTGLAWRRDAGGLRAVRTDPGGRRGRRAGGRARPSWATVPEDLVAACARHRLPLFAVNESVAFATITEHVVRQVSGERAGDLAAVVDRHRRMMTSGPAGGGPDVVLDLLGSDLDLRAWVLSPTGRQIAGAEVGGHRAARRACARALAASIWRRRRTAAGGGPHRADRRAATTYSLFPIRRHRPRRPRRGAPGTCARPCCPTGCWPSRPTRATGPPSGSTCCRASPS